MKAFGRDVGIAPTATATAAASSASQKHRPPHSCDLRKGRRSTPGQTYLITTVTAQRQPVFADFYAARHLIRLLKNAAAQQTARTLAFVVMPDHLHWLMTLGHSQSLPTVVQGIKILSAKHLGRSLWQAGYHDHAIRSDEDLQAIARYIVANPLRAQLVDKIGDYPHWDAIWF